MSIHLLPADLLPPVPFWRALQAGSCPAEVGEGDREQLGGQRVDEEEERSWNCSCHLQRTQQAPEPAVTC